VFALFEYSGFRVCFHFFGAEFQAMFGIDPLSLSALMILVSGRTLECPTREPTKINIVPRTEEVEFDTSQSLRDIQGYSMDTVDPYGFHGNTITQGFMKGTIGLEQRITFGEAQMKRYGASCVWYDTITIELVIDPTIVIASEISKDRCMAKAIGTHELKHVRVDREIVNKYAKQMGTKLFDALKTRGFSAGPFKSDRKEEVTEKMQRVVQQILELEYQKMDIERRERQRDVDSLGEYESVDEQCPNFEKKKKKLYADVLKDR
jgi:hypothetical protein